MQKDIENICSLLKEYGFSMFISSNSTLASHLCNMFCEKDTFIFISSSGNFCLQVGSLEISRITSLFDKERTFCFEKDVKNWIAENIAIGSKVCISDQMKVSHFQKLTSILKDMGIDFVINGQIEQLARVSKSVSDLKKIKYSHEIMEAGFFHIIKHLREGISEKEVFCSLKAFWTKEYGCWQSSFEPIIAFGENSAHEHHFSGSRCLKNGDIVMVDIGVIADGFCSDCTRTFEFGKTWETDFYDVWATVAISKCNSEQKLCHWSLKEVDSLARQIIDDTGYKGLFTHSLGHGVGIEIHEAPHYGYKTKAPDSSVITVEPAIYIKGKFGVRLEDCWAIIGDNKLVLNNIPMYHSFNMYLEWMS